MPAHAHVATATRKNKTRLRLVHSAKPWPINAESEARPWRLWDAKARALMRWRNYAHLRHAHVGALIECRWAQVGACIEVFDTRNGKLSGQYIRRVHSVEFIGESTP